MADFMANLDRINALADHSPGFVWRLQDDSGNATSVSPTNDNLIVNMSVWDDVASLNHYVYKTAHVEIMKRRKEWFERMQDNHFVLWWVPRGHVADRGGKPWPVSRCCAPMARRRWPSPSATPLPNRMRQ